MAFAFVYNNICSLCGDRESFLFAPNRNQNTYKQIKLNRFELKRINGQHKLFIVHIVRAITVTIIKHKMTNRMRVSLSPFSLPKKLQSSAIGFVVCCILSAH